MSDNIEGTPSALPMESRYTIQKRTASQKFLMLQAQLSTSNTMYSGGAPKKTVLPPAHSKQSGKLKQNAGKEDEVDSDSISNKSNQSQKLVHRTLERPKRKGIRTPSKSSLSGTLLNTINTANQSSRLLPANTPPDFDQPPLLPTSAPPPSIGEFPLLSDIVSSSPIIDDVFAADSSVSPELPNDSNKLLPQLPINDGPMGILNSSLSSHDSVNNSSFSSPPSMNKSLPTEEPPYNKPPPSIELLPINNGLSHTPSSHYKTAHLIDSSLLVVDEPTTTSTDSLSSTTKKDTSPMCDPPESPPYDASPPPLPNPPKAHDQHQLDNDQNIPHHEYKEKEHVNAADSHSMSPYVISNSSEFSNVKQHEKLSPPLMSSSHSVWSSSFHTSSLRSSPSVEYQSKSFEDKSDYLLNLSNASFFKVPSADTSTNVITPGKKSLIDNKPSSNVSKFQDRIAILKRKRENLMPSPATSVQSEVIAVNSRVTSPLQSSYSATLLDLTDVTLSKPCANYATNISPTHISSEELLTPLQSSPVSHATTNFLQFASNPPIISSDVKRVEPFTVKEISSSRINNTAITSTQLPPLFYSNDSEGFKFVDVHSESAFSKPSFTDNATIVLSGLPADVSVSNTDVYHSDDDDDDGLTPPPLPSSLPPDAFESDSIFSQADVDATQPDLPAYPPPSIPEKTDGLEDETLSNGVPLLPMFPIPSLNEQPFIESPSIEPPKNFSQTPPTEIKDIQIAAPAEFTIEEIVHDKVKTIQVHNTGLQPQVLQQSSPKTLHPNSSYNLRGLESASQISTSTGGSSHSIHLQYDLEPEKNKSGTLPMFICQHLFTQHQDDELSDYKTQKGYKKASKLKFPWQKRLGHDRSHSMSDERLKRKGKKSSKEDIRHSSIDIKKGITDSSIMPRGSSNINRLKVANEPVTSASVDDLRRPRAADQNISASHSELSKGSLAPPVLTIRPSPVGKKSPKDEPDIASSLNQQQSLKMPDTLGESTISLPHMTTPELYKKLSQPSDPSLFESIMKDFPLFNTDSSLTENMIEQPVDERKEKSTSANQQYKVPAEQEEPSIAPETLPDQKESSLTTDTETAVFSCQMLLNSKHSDSLHDVTMDSFGSPPSPMGSVQSHQGWSSSAANAPNFHGKRWKDSALGSINTLTSNDSIRDLLKNRVTIGDWNVDHVIQWLESVELSSVVPVFRQFSINGAKLKALNDSKLGKLSR